MFIVLGSNRDVPLYEQIVEEIKAKILSGELAAGDALPSIRQLASELLISVITTKRAYQELEAQGFIETRPGKGSFVSTLSVAAAHHKRLAETEARLRDVVSNALRMGLDGDQLSSLFALVLAQEEKNSV